MLPLKGGQDAKSRLGGPPALAAAIALDCLAAVVACAAVARTVVVTPDGGLGSRAADLGAEVVGESAPGAGLLAAVADGIRVATGPAAVLLGDLPALHPDDLAMALEVARRALTGAPMAHLADADGTGTVLLAALRPDDLRPWFGPGSAAAHAAAGSLALDLDLPRLRHDVDTPADLAFAAALGVGPRTCAELAARGLLAVRC